MTSRYAMDFTPAELEMIAAANSLCGIPRTRALADIAAITGRTHSAVTTKARRTRRKERDLAVRARCLQEQASGVVDQGRGPYRIKELTALDIDGFPETGVP